MLLLLMARGRLRRFVSKAAAAATAFSLAASPFAGKAEASVRRTGVSTAREAMQERGLMQKKPKVEINMNVLGKFQRDIVEIQRLLSKTPAEQQSFESQQSKRLRKLPLEKLRAEKIKLQGLKDAAEVALSGMLRSVFGQPETRRNEIHSLIEGYSQASSTYSRLLGVVEKNISAKEVKKMKRDKSSANPGFYKRGDESRPEVKPAIQNRKSGMKNIPATRQRGRN